MRKSEGNAGTVAAIGLGGVLALGLGGVRFIYGSETDMLNVGYSALIQEDCRTELKTETSNPRVIFELSKKPIIEEDLIDLNSLSDRTEFKSYVKSKAEEHNLTLVDNEKVLEELDSSENIHEMIEATSTHTKSGYGFSVDFPIGYDLKDLPNIYRPFDRDNYDSEQFKNITKNLVKNLYFVPTELIELANIDRVVIVAQNSFDLVPDFITTQKSPDAVYYFPKDTIYMSLDNHSAENFQTQFDFTLSAAIDMNVCGITQVNENLNFSTFENIKAIQADENKIDTESVNFLTTQIQSLNKKARINRNYISPRSPINLSQINQQELNTILFNVLRINEHVPGYLDFWRSLTYEDQISNEKIIIDFSTDSSA